MKIIDIKKEKDIGRAFIKFEIDGEEFHFSFVYRTNNPNAQAYAMGAGGGGLGQAIYYNTQPQSFDISDEEFTAKAKKEIGQFIASKLFADYEMLKNLKK